MTTRAGTSYSRMEEVLPSDEGGGNQAERRRGEEGDRGRDSIEEGMTVWLQLRG